MKIGGLSTPVPYRFFSVPNLFIFIQAPPTKLQFVSVAVVILVGVAAADAVVVYGGVYRGSLPIDHMIVSNNNCIWPLNTNGITKKILL